MRLLFKAGIQSAFIKLIFFAPVALAQGPVISGLGGSPGSSLTIQGVYAIILGLACWLKQIAMFIVVVALLVYGLMFLWAQGNPTAFGAAKTAFGWGILGAMIVIGSYTIIATVASFGGLLPAGTSYTVILAPFSGCSTMVFN